MSTPEFDLALRVSAADVIRLHPEWKARVERGLLLALNGAAVYPAGGPWQVRSASDEEVVYRLLPDGCECPDRQRAPTGQCKHWWSVYLMHAAHEKGAPHVEDK